MPGTTSPVPTPRPGPFGGHFLQLRRDPPGYLLRCARELGDAFRLKTPFLDIYVLSNPEHVRDVLVTEHAGFGRSWEYKVMKLLLGDGLLTVEGDQHRRQRKLVLPAFQHSRIAAYADVMVRDAARRSMAWKEGETVDMAAEMMNLTLLIVGRTLFGDDLDRESRALNRALQDALEAYFRALNPLRYALRGTPLPTFVRFRRAKRLLDAVVQRMIDDHRCSGTDTGDLISMLLLAQDEDDGSFMTDQQVRDEAMTLLAAGHETTAMALTWTWYLLSQNPEAVAKLHEELEAVLGGRVPGFADLKQLAYTRQVVTEAIRLYPPAWVIARQAHADSQVGAAPIPKGSTIFLSPYLVHRDARYFPDPDRFDPARWTPEFRKALPKHAYFPFGSGPRVCIGEQFAWMEAVIVLATLAQRWQPRLVPGHPVVPVSRLTLRPGHGMKMVLEHRAPAETAPFLADQVASDAHTQAA